MNSRQINRQIVKAFALLMLIQFLVFAGVPQWVGQKITGLPLSGGTMSGNINMGGNAVTNLGTVASDCISWSDGSATLQEDASGRLMFTVGSNLKVHKAAYTAIGFELSNSAGSGAIFGLNATATAFYSNIPFMRNVTAGITASTTQSQGQQPLVADINQVSTCANANDVVTLPTALAGFVCVVINSGAQTLQVFPASGDDLGAGVNNSTTIATTKIVRFIAYDTTNWVAIADN